MNDVTNLNKYRKAKALQEQKTEADRNAARFGRTKAERLAEAARSEKLKRHLDQLKFEDE